MVYRQKKSENGQLELLRTKIVKKYLWNYTLVFGTLHMSSQYRKCLS